MQANRGAPLYLFVAPAVSADAADAAVDHLDAAEQRLQGAHAQQDGEQADVPLYRILGEHAHVPHGGVAKVAGVTTVGG